MAEYFAGNWSEAFIDISTKLRGTRGWFISGFPPGVQHLEAYIMDRSPRHLTTPVTSFLLLYKTMSVSDH